MKAVQTGDGNIEKCIPEINRLCAQDLGMAYMSNYNMQWKQKGSDLRSTGSDGLQPRHQFSEG